VKQIIQNLKTGETILEEVPAPMVKRGHVLIQTKNSLVSLGTEKMLVEFGKSNLIGKARQQPEKVKQVLDKIKTDGLLPTLEAVFNKLDEPLPLGYCNAGVVIEVGADVSEFKVGDRVASNGPHAEIVCVPKNLCALIPDAVSYEEASFTVIGAIGLQGIRLVNPTMGEKIVVVGLGLIGLITAELLKANGCDVYGFDFDQNKVDVAKRKGVNAFNPGKDGDPVKIIENLTNGIGCDGVIITASTKSNDVISQSAQMSRKRGRIVLVGVIGLDINRSDFYKKELSFQVSCSYGPGRYDESYESNGIDYPLPYVRWTQKRNFETVLSSISKGTLNVKELITENILLKDYNEIYGSMGKGSIASLLNYDSIGNNDTKEVIRTIELNNLAFVGTSNRVGVIGAGNFTKMTMLPALKKAKAGFRVIASANGMTSTALGKKYGFQKCTSDYKEILKDSEVDLVMITTRHNTHAKMVLDSLEAGKNVFVEKPLAIRKSELDEIRVFVENEKSPKCIHVGYNRRFSPFSIKAKNLIGNSNTPINMIATMNAGYIPADSWVHDMNVGGGRIIGEACHYIDLMMYFCGSKVVSVFMSALGTSPVESTDNAIITLNFENGSQGVINYFSNGSKSYSKERVEVFFQEKVLIMDNFKKLEGFGIKGFSSTKGMQDKGHNFQFSELLNRISNGGKPLISFEDIYNSTSAAFAALESLKTGQKIIL
jgi:predicted dehydrogenase/threonine dehydrogenase-like Zn-dependent dehydrogenase